MKCLMKAMHSLWIKGLCFKNRFGKGTLKYFLIITLIICLSISSLFLASCTIEEVESLLNSGKTPEKTGEETFSQVQDSDKDTDTDHDKKDLLSSGTEANDNTGSQNTTPEPENNLMFLSSEANFAFVYSHKDLALSSYPAQPGDYGDMSLSVSITGLEMLEGDTRDKALDEREALENGDFGPDTDFSFEPSREVVERNGINVKEFLVFGRYDVCDVAFDRKAVFYNNGYQVQITLCADKETITESMGQYFTYDEINCREEIVWDHELQDEFYEKLVSKQAASPALDWYKTFDEIMYLLQINEFKGASAGYSRIIDKRYYEASEDDNYIIDISYPQFQSAVAAGLDDSINKIIYKDIILSNMNTFKAEIAAYDYEDDTFNYLLSIAYRVVTYNENGISLCLDIYPYLGGAHGMTYFETINFDLNNNKLIGLEDLFEQGYGYLEVISGYCRRDLKEQMDKQGWQPDEQWIEEGTDPGNTDTFTNFLVAPSGLIVKFPAYQVAPYAAGDFSVLIPYGQFEGHVNPDSMIAQYVR